METQSLEHREPETAIILDQIEVEPEIREYLLAFLQKMVEGYTNQGSDPFGERKNDFGIQNFTYYVPSNVIQLLQAAQLLNKTTVLSDGTPVEDKVKALREEKVARSLSEISILPDGSNVIEAMSKLQLLLNEFFVYMYEQNGGNRSPRKYSCSSTFGVPEQIANDILAKCLSAVRISFSKLNVIDYFWVVECYERICEFLVGGGFCHASSSCTPASPAIMAVVQEIRKNHLAMTPDKIQADVSEDKARIAGLKELEDSRIVAAIEEQCQLLCGKIEDVLSLRVGISRGKEFTGLGLMPDADLDGIFSDFANLSKGKKSYRDFAYEFRRKHRDPDFKLKYYIKMYEEIFKKVVKDVVEICKPLKVFVFGSVAKGTFTDNSDLDLFVVVDDNADVDLLHAKLDEAGLTKGNDVVLRRISEFDENKSKLETIDSVVDVQGKSVYENGLRKVS
jgi:uncharacterized protein